MEELVNTLRPSRFALIVCFAVLALVSGAWDYLRKPLDFARLQLNLRRAEAYRQAKLADPFEVGREAIIGNHPSLLACLAMAAQAAATDGAVLITGESGTGKELFAQLVHDNSKRHAKALVTVDCTNLTATLASSLLFGYRRGAFTGPTATPTASSFRPTAAPSSWTRLGICPSTLSAPF
jgi:two-component system NtrC family response regulator